MALSRKEVEDAREKLEAGQEGAKAADEHLRELRDARQASLAARQAARDQLRAGMQIVLDLLDYGGSREDALRASLRLSSWVDGHESNIARAVTFGRILAALELPPEWRTVWLRQHRKFIEEELEPRTLAEFFLRQERLDR